MSPAASTTRREPRRNRGAIGRVVLAALLAVAAAGPACAQQTSGGAQAEGPFVWPGQQWCTAEPESKGLSSAAPRRRRGIRPANHGGGSGCIIRHGYLVKEWGDPKTLADIKSATKGICRNDSAGSGHRLGLITLDDLAVKHYPSIGAENAGKSAETGSPRSRSAISPP